MHACVTYSHVGSWYTMEGENPPLASKVPFVFWQGHLQSFFMGILFLLAGYFAHGSLERRGPAGFLRERLFRLGLPALLYMAALHPLIVFVLNPGGYDHGPLARAYLRYLVSGRFLGGSGPMWFAVALLAFSAVLAAWRVLRRPAPAVGAPRRRRAGPLRDRGLGRRPGGCDLPRPHGAADRLLRPQHAALLLSPIHARLRRGGSGRAPWMASAPRALRACPPVRLGGALPGAGAPGRRHRRKRSPAGREHPGPEGRLAPRVARLLLLGTALRHRPRARRPRLLLGQAGQADAALALAERALLRGLPPASAAPRPPRGRCFARWKRASFRGCCS